MEYDPFDPYVYKILESINTILKEKKYENFDKDDFYELLLQYKENLE